MAGKDVHLKDERYFLAIIYVACEFMAKRLGITKSPMEHWLPCSTEYVTSSTSLHFRFRNEFSKRGKDDRMLMARISGGTDSFIGDLMIGKAKNNKIITGLTAGRGFLYFLFFYRIMGWTIPPYSVNTKEEEANDLLRSLWTFVEWYFFQMRCHHESYYLPCFKDLMDAIGDDNWIMDYYWINWMTTDTSLFTVREGQAGKAKEGKDDWMIPWLRFCRMIYEGVRGRRPVSGGQTEFSRWWLNDPVTEKL